MTAVGDVDLQEMFPGQTKGIPKKLGIEGKEAWRRFGLTQQTNSRYK